MTYQGTTQEPCYSGSSTRTHRKVLVLKGLVYGIPEKTIALAMTKLDAIVTTNHITTVVWDGDKRTYPNASTNQLRTMSFTCLLEDLYDRHPHLEFIFFKKKGGARSLLRGADLKTTKYGTILGPYWFLSDESTRILSETGRVPGYRRGRHLGVEFEGITSYDELGVRGFSWTKRKLKCDSVQQVIVGLGDVVRRENTTMSLTPDAFPLRTVTRIAVRR